MIITIIIMFIIIIIVIINYCFCYCYYYFCISYRYHFYSDLLWCSVFQLQFTYVSQIEPKKRPPFVEIVQSLEAMKSSAQMAVILADFSRLGSGARIILDRMILEQILRTFLMIGSRGSGASLWR